MYVKGLRRSFIRISTFALIFMNCLVFASVDMKCQQYQIPNGTDVRVECSLQTITANVSFTKIPINKTTILTLQCRNTDSISQISGATFQKFFRLRILIIKECKFESLPEESFKGAKSLLELRMLLRNSFKYEFHMPPTLSDDLQLLTFLSLEGIGIKTMPNIFWSNLPNLQKLSLKMNQIKNLDWLNALANQSLTSLDLSQNLLNTLSPKVFHVFPSLLALHLDDNVFEFVDEEAFLGLSVLTTLTLNRVNLTQLPACLFHNLTKLLTLQLSGNNICNLPKGIFNDLNKLQALNIQKNNIRFSESAHKPFRELVELQILNLAENHISELTEETFQGLEQIRRLYLPFNNLINVSAKVFAVVAKPLEFLDISNSNLNSLDLLNCFSFLKNLSLGNNKLQIIQPEHLEQSKHSLQVINLENASLSTITQIGKWGENAIFANFSILSHLNISGNMLDRFDYFMVPDSLTYLDISSNRVNVLEDIFSLRTKKKITSLYLNHNTFQEFNAHSFSHSLEKLDCNYCVVHVIRSGTFGELHRLANVSFVNTKISKIERFAFSVSPGIPKVTPFVKFERNFCSQSVTPIISSIQFIYLNQDAFPHICRMTTSCKMYNDRNVNNVHDNISRTGSEDRTAKKFSFIESATLDCGNNNLRSFNSLLAKASAINILYLDGNFLLLLTSEMLSKYTSLEVLYLNNSQVEEIEKGFFRPRKLQELYLDNNNIKVLHPNIFYNVENIKIISLRNNKLSSIPLNLFKRLKLLHTLNLDHNYFSQFYGFEFGGLTGLHVLTLSNNKLKKVLHGSFNELHSLREFHLEYNKLTKFFFSGSKELVKLFLNDNKFRSIAKQTFRITVKLEELHLERNEISDINLPMMDQLNSLTKLHLEENKLRLLNSTWFKGMTSLTQLHVNNNCLTEISGKTFRFAPFLEGIFLHNNRIKKIEPESFLVVAHLRGLSLHNNQLTNLSVWKLPTSLQSVSLKGNNLTCSCNYLIPFRNWAIGYEGSNKIIDINDVICEYENGSRALLPVLQHTQRYCETRVSVQVILLLSGGCFALLIMLSVLLYMHRLEMQVWFYTRFGHRIFYQDNCADLGKVYHAFVAYSNEDEVFVAEELVRVLEPEFNLCVHVRDFPVGAYITETVCKVVEMSCRTILVLSNSFIKSEWCRLEFKIAHYQTIQDRCCRLIVILMDDVDVNDADRELKVYLKTKTYLRWDDRFFWEKLKFAMPDVKGLNAREERQPLLRQQLESY